MDNLVTIKLEESRDVKLRKGVIDAFKGSFLNKELSAVKTKGNITKTDKLLFPGYFVSRKDLIQMLLDISSDISIDNISFKDILSKVLDDPKVISSVDSKIGIGINFGFGFSREIPNENPQKKIRISQELQLVIDTLGAVEVDKPSAMISSYTTANLHALIPPTTPPNGGTPYPDVRI